MDRFTAYRRNMSARDTHTHLQKNADNEPQFEGVIFHDGKVVIHWCTAVKSVSVFDSLQDMITIHGHPEYGTEIVFHDSIVPQAWQDALNKYAASLITKFEDSIDPHALAGEVDHALTR